MLRDDSSDISVHTKSLIKQRLAIIQRKREQANINTLKMFKIWEDKTFGENRDTDVEPLERKLDGLGLWSSEKRVKADLEADLAKKIKLDAMLKSKNELENTINPTQKSPKTIIPKGVELKGDPVSRVIRVEEARSESNRKSRVDGAPHSSAILEYERSPRPGRKSKLSNKIAPNVDKVKPRPSASPYKYNNRFGKFRSPSPVEVKIVITKEDEENNTQKETVDVHSPPSHVTTDDNKTATQPEMKNGDDSCASARPYSRQASKEDRGGRSYSRQGSGDDRSSSRRGSAGSMDSKNRPRRQSRPNTPTEI